MFYCEVGFRIRYTSDALLSYILVVSRFLSRLVIFCKYLYYKQGVKYLVGTRNGNRNMFIGVQKILLKNCPFPLLCVSLDIIYTVIGLRSLCPFILSLRLTLKDEKNVLR
jgi:hypothetical protein